MAHLPAAVEIIKSQYRAAGGAEDAFVEIRDNGQEVIIGGNRPGLLGLVLHILALAERDSRGAHFHLDAHSGADVAERALVFRQATPDEV